MVVSDIGNVLKATAAYASGSFKRRVFLSKTSHSSCSGRRRRTSTSPTPTPPLHTQEKNHLEEDSELNCGLKPEVTIQGPKDLLGLANLYF